MAAQAAIGEALRLQIRTAILDHVSGDLIGMVAECASARRELEAAAFLYGAAHAVRDHAEIELDERVNHSEERLRKQTSESAFEAVFAQGYSLSPREALKHALAWSDENTAQVG
jgi:hypothetical protein